MAGAFGQAWDILKREDYRQAGGTLIRDSEGRVLLVRRNELLPDGTLKPGGSFHGMYELPGGNVDPGETPQEGVARETLEETGLPLVNMTALEPNVYDDKRKVYHGFTADIDPSHEGDVQLSDEHEKYLWMHPHEALAMNEHPDGMDMPRWLSQDAITFFRGMVGGDDMQGEPMTKSGEGAFEQAWQFLKADPKMNIREMASYSTAYPMNRRDQLPGQMTTMNPIIARLIRERNEQRAADRGGILHDFMRQQPTEPHKLDREYFYPSTVDQFGGDNRPYSTYGPQGMSYMPGPSYDEKKEQSKDAHEAQGVVPGDKFSGDYVARPSGGTATDTGRRRQKTTFATQLEFPYGGSRGDYPINVQPDSPMAQMYEYAPKLRRLPENMQPDWMSEFQEEY